MMSLPRRLERDSSLSWQPNGHSVYQPLTFVSLAFTWRNQYKIVIIYRDFHNSGPDIWLPGAITTEYAQYQKQNELHNYHCSSLLTCSLAGGRVKGSVVSFCTWSTTSCRCDNSDNIATSSSCNTRHDKACYDQQIKHSKPSVGAWQKRILAFVSCWNMDAYKQKQKRNSSNGYGIFEN